MEDHMATNLAIDDVLLERARRVGKLRTKKETVTQALTEFIRRQQEILKSLGTINSGGMGYKKDRRDRESGR
jgi:Arc/MetJ family transcription regulator